MFEESVSLWASMYSWFTPTVLFVFLNLMIGTIAISNSFFASKSEGHSHRLHQIQQSPSVLHRLKSISAFYTSPHGEPISMEQNQKQSHLSGSPSVLQRIKSFNLFNYISQEEDAQVEIDESQQREEAIGTEEIEKEEQNQSEEEKEEDESRPTMDEVYSKLKRGHVGHVSRTRSDTEPVAGDIPPKLPRNMKKSASTKSPFGHFEEKDVVEARRPATVREGRRVRAAAGDADEEVDAKADIFISKIKHQLKLQRLDSILRYKEMVRKAGGK